MRASPIRNLGGALRRAPYLDEKATIDWTRRVLALAVILVLFPAAERGQQPQQPNSTNPSLLSVTNGLPDNTDTARLKQISADSDQLVALALSLKAEVDKTNKDTLSLNVIRKAAELKKLAHNVQEKMKKVQRAD